MKTHFKVTNLDKLVEDLYDVPYPNRRHLDQIIQDLRTTDQKNSVIIPINNGGIAHAIFILIDDKIINRHDRNYKVKTYRYDGTIS